MKNYKSDDQYIQAITNLFFDYMRNVFPGYFLE